MVSIGNIMIYLFIKQRYYQQIIIYPANNMTIKILFDLLGSGHAFIFVVAQNLNQPLKLFIKLYMTVSKA